MARSKKEPPKKVGPRRYIKKGDIRTAKEIQDDFLEQYEALGNITLACKKAKVPRRTFYNWMDDKNESNAAFIEAFETSNKIAIGTLEAELHRRAVTGVRKGIFYKGKKVATELQLSDTLLMFLLKAKAPEKYKDRVANEHSGPDGKPITHDVTHHVIFTDNGG